VLIEIRTKLRTKIGGGKDQQCEGAKVLLSVQRRSLISQGDIRGEGEGSRTVFWWRGPLPIPTKKGSGPVGRGGANGWLWGPRQEEILASMGRKILRMKDNYLVKKTPG